MGDTPKLYRPKLVRTPSRLATAVEVARLAGVSQSAVSRTFTPGASVSKATRAKVENAAKALGYRPNQIARSLSTNRSGVIGVAITHLDNQFYPAVIEALSEQLSQIGYRILLFVTHGQEDLDPVLDEVLGYRVDALILASSSLSSKLAKECIRAGVPAVMLNNLDTNSESPGVGGDNVEGGRKVAAFLVAGGHRRFAFISGVRDSSTSEERELGFRTGLGERGCAPPLLADGQYRFDGAQRAMRDLMALSERPDAIFCANDHMALAALQTAQSEFGLAPGKDISIIGFDDVEISSWPAFQLTTYSQPVEPLVRNVVNIVQAMISGEAATSLSATVSGELIVRNSARIPKSGVTVLPNGTAVWSEPKG